MHLAGTPGSARGPLERKRSPSSCPLFVTGKGKAEGDKERNKGDRENVFGRNRREGGQGGIPPPSNNSYRPWAKRL